KAASPPCTPPPSPPCTPHNFPLTHRRLRIQLPASFIAVHHPLPAHALPRLQVAYRRPRDFHTILRPRARQVAVVPISIPISVAVAVAITVAVTRHHAAVVVEDVLAATTGVVAFITRLRLHATVEPFALHVRVAFGSWGRAE